MTLPEGGAGTWTKPFVEEPDGLSFKEKKRRLIRACGPVCACCGRRFPKKKLQLDHLVPRTDGGSDNLTNLCLLCGPCNAMKSNRFTISECRRRYRALSEPDVWPEVLDRVARCARAAAGADAALDRYRYRDRSRAAREAREYAQETISELSVALSDASTSIFKHSALIRYAERRMEEQKELVAKAPPSPPPPARERAWTQDAEYRKAKAERAAAKKAKREAERALEENERELDKVMAGWEESDDRIDRLAAQYGYDSSYARAARRASDKYRNKYDALQENGQVLWAALYGENGLSSVETAPLLEPNDPAEDVRRRMEAEMLREAASAERKRKARARHS